MISVRVKVKVCEVVKKSKNCYSLLLMMALRTDRNNFPSGIHAIIEPEELVGATLVAITNLPPRAMMGIDWVVCFFSAVHRRG